MLAGFLSVFFCLCFFFSAAFSWQKYNIDNSVWTFSETTVTGYWLSWRPNLEDMSVQWNPYLSLALLKFQQLHVIELTLSFLFSAYLLAGFEKFCVLPSYSGADGHSEPAPG